MSKALTAEQFEAVLKEILGEVDGERWVEDGVSEGEHVAVETFRETGQLTTDSGLIVRTRNARYALTIQVRDR